VGVTYEPQYLSQEAYDAIISGSTARGGGRGNGGNSGRRSSRGGSGGRGNQQLAAE
jgi:hypothetical protein